MAKTYGKCKLCKRDRFLNFAYLCKKCNRTPESIAIKDEIAERRQKALEFQKKERLREEAKKAMEHKEEEVTADESAEEKQTEQEEDAGETKEEETPKEEGKKGKDK